MKYKKDKAPLPYMGAMTAAQQAAQSILPQEQQQQVGQSSVMNTSLGNVVQRSRKPQTGLQDFSDPNQMVQDSQRIGGNQAFLNKSPLKNVNQYIIPQGETDPKSGSGAYEKPGQVIDSQNQVDIDSLPPNNEAVNDITSGNTIQSDLTKVPEKTEVLQGKIDALNKSGANPAKLARLKGRLDRTKTRQSARAERVEGRNVKKKQRVEDYQKMRNDEDYSAVDFVKDRFKKKNKNQNINSSSNNFFGGMNEF
jgi:hypothetical protein